MSDQGLLFQYFPEKFSWFLVFGIVIANKYSEFEIRK